MSEVIDPLIYKKDLVGGTYLTVPQQYNVPMAQAPLSRAGYANYERISIYMQMAQIDVSKKQAFIDQKLEFERKKNEMKIRNQERMKMISYEICKNSLDQIIYASVGIDGENICFKVLLNVWGYRAVLLRSFYPESHIVLKISWKDCKEAVYLENGLEGISANIFLKRLKAKGVVLRSSKRQEIAVADALLSYSLNTTEEYEIPWSLGWNMMENCRWHFAHENEITMRGVLKYV